MRLGPNPRPGAPRAEWWKIIAMGVVLAGLVWLTFLYEPKAANDLGNEPPVTVVRVETPKLDAEILAQVKDATRDDRLVLEPEPLAHLLERSLRVVPTVAKELGLPEHPIPVERLRADPTSYRGAYLGYRGELKYLSPGLPGHPVSGFMVHEGWIETDAGETILFRVSLVSPEVQVGEHVRAEGFFLKLRDSHHLPKAEQAPLLVGPELYPDYVTWAPVTQLDRAVLDQVEDGRFVDGQLVDRTGIDLDLEESQDAPLWHLASYARSRIDRPLVEWRSEPALVSKEQLDQIKSGELPRGTPMRLLGTFVMARTFAARPNPIGVEFWTVAWLQIRLNGKLIPVWIPDRIGDWQRNEDLEVRGYWFKRLLYRSDYDAEVLTPVFVAARLDGYEQLPAHPATAIVQWVFAGATLAVILLFVFLARRDRRDRADFEQRLTERRRRRSGNAAVATGG